MPASLVFDTVTVAPGSKTVWFSFEWAPGDQPNKGPMVCMASPNSGASVESRLTVEDFQFCRHGPPQTYVFYYGYITNLGTQAVGSRIMAVYFPELQGDWS